MTNLMLGLYAETHLHPGSGRNDGAIDLPVMREKITGYPVIPGSSLKGALRAKARVDQAGQTVDQLFGKQEGAGGILVGDARLLLLPIRSLNSAFKWLICPHIIKRLLRDLRRSKPQQLANSIAVPSIEQGHCLVFAQNSTGQPTALYLEERRLQAQSDPQQHADLMTLLSAVTPAEIDQQELAQRLVVVHDDDFSWFSGNSLPVHARNVLDADTKASKNLWYEETLPPETLFYTLLLPRANPRLMHDFREALLGSNHYLQVGGNETIGQGWLAMNEIQWSAQEAV